MNVDWKQRLACRQTWCVPDRLSHRHTDRCRQALASRSIDDAGIGSGRRLGEEAFRQLHRQDWGARRDLFPFTGEVQTAKPALFGADPHTALSPRSGRMRKAPNRPALEREVSADESTVEVKTVEAEKSPRACNQGADLRRGCWQMDRTSISWSIATSDERSAASTGALFHSFDHTREVSMTKVFLGRHKRSTIVTACYKHKGERLSLN